jgi:hypothetical protein
VFNLLLTLLSNLILPAIGPALPFILNFIKVHWRAILFDSIVVALGLAIYSCDSIKTELKNEKLAHKTDIQKFKDGQLAADNLAKQEKIRLDKQNKDKADAADKNYLTLLSQYNANLVRFKANQNLTNQSGSGQSGQATEGTSGPGKSTDLLGITLDDAQICADNTARLKVAHDWAVDIQKGDK